MSILPNLVIALIFALLSLVPVISRGKTDRDKDGLRGQVHHIRIERAPLSSSGAEEARMLSQIITYDSVGNKTEVTTYKPDGSLNWKWVAHYDDNGRRLYESQYGSDKSIDTITKYEYDANKRKEKEVEYRKEALQGWSIYKYNERGYIRERKYYKADSSLCFQEIYEYDVNGNITMQSRYDAGCRGQFHFPHKVLYAYDSEENLTEKRFYENPEGGFSGKIVYTYGPFGNVSEEAHYGSGGSLESKYTYTYEFDSIGNWTRRFPLREVINSDKPDRRQLEVLYRTITYF